MQRYPFVATQLIKGDRLKYRMVRMQRTVIAGEPFRIGRPYHLGLFRILTTHGQILIEIHNNFAGAGFYNFRRTLAKAIVIAFVFPLFVRRNGARAR